MRTSLVALLAFFALAVNSPLHAQVPDPAAAAPNPPATQSVPAWDAGARVPRDFKEPPGRFHAKNALMSFTLPEDWRGDDVVVREFLADEARALHPSADAIVFIEYVPARGKPMPLVKIYRMPLASWRKLEDAKTANFGRLTMNTPETAYIVDRSEHTYDKDRFSKLRDGLEDLLITLAVYDPAIAAAAIRRPVADFYSGTLPGGEPVTLDLSQGGSMKLTWTKTGKSISGQWMQRNNQVIMLPIMADGKAGGSILMHFDEHSLVVVTWDEKALGAAGARLEPDKIPAF